MAAITCYLRYLPTSLAQAMYEKWQRTDLANKQKPRVKPLLAGNGSPDSVYPNVSEMHFGGHL